MPRACRVPFRLPEPRCLLSHIFQIRQALSLSLRPMIPNWKHKSRSIPQWHRFHKQPPVCKISFCAIIIASSSKARKLFFVAPSFQFHSPLNIPWLSFIHQLWFESHLESSRTRNLIAKLMLHLKDTCK